MWNNVVINNIHFVYTCICVCVFLRPIHICTCFNIQPKFNRPFDASFIKIGIDPRPIIFRTFYMCIHVCVCVCMCVINPKQGPPETCVNIICQMFCIKLSFYVHDKILFYRCEILTLRKKRQENTSKVLKCVYGN